MSADYKEIEFRTRMLNSILSRLVNALSGSSIHPLGAGITRPPALLSDEQDCRGVLGLRGGEPK